MTPLKRLFDKPIAGAALQIPARHPIQVWLMLGLAASAFFQLRTGQSPQSARVMSHTLYLTQAVAMGFGALLCLLSAVVAERKPWDAIGLSLAGMTTLSVVFAYYTVLTFVTVPNPLVSVSFWFIFALFGGVCTRMAQLVWLAVRIVKQP
jgi:VIT1/CCC1 family predicted Fe2+/Mn2+ transporter